MWGGFGGKESRPQQIKSSWHLAAEFMPNFTLTVRSGHSMLSSREHTMTQIQGHF